MSLSRAQNIFMPANINSIVILQKSTLRVFLPFSYCPSTSKGYKSMQTKTTIFVFVLALKRAILNILTMGYFNLFLDFFLGGVLLLHSCCFPSYVFTWLSFDFMEGLQCLYAASLLWPTRLFRRMSSNAICHLNALHCRCLKKLVLNRVQLL